MAVVDFYIDATIESEALTHSVTEKKRNITDLPFFVIFAMLFTTWLGVSTYAHVTGPSFLQLYKDLYPYVRQEQEKLLSLLQQSRKECILFIWITVMNLTFYFLTLRWATKYALYATGILMSILIGASVIAVFYIRLFFLLPFLAATYIFLITVAIILKNVGTKVVCQLIQDSCKVMIHCPMSIPVVTLEIILCFLISGFQGLTMFYLLYNNQTHADTKVINDDHANENITLCKPLFHKMKQMNMVLAIASLYFAIWLQLLISIFVQMTLHNTFLNWYLSKDKKKVSYFTTLRYMYYISRYHMGTLVFGSTIFTIIYLIKGVYNFIKYHFTESVKKPITVFCLVIVILNSTTNALIVSTFYGRCFYKSMERSLQLIMQKPKEYVVTYLVASLMLFFGVLLIPSISSILYIYLYTNDLSYLIIHKENVMCATVIISISSILITLFVLYIFAVAIESVLFGYSVKLHSDAVLSLDHSSSMQSIQTNII